MFDRNNLVCRLFVAYVLQEVHGDEYTPEGCLWIVNKFYDKVEEFSKDYTDAYQRAARRTPLGFAAFFVNAERQYQLALDNPKSELGRLLFNAEMKAASTPVPYPIYVRLHAYPDIGITAYKFFRKLGRGKYELIPQYERTVGFLSKAKAERRARELENGGAVNASKR